MIQLLIIDLLARSKHFWWLDSQNRGNQEIWMLVMHYEEGFSKTALIWIKFQTITSVLFYLIVRKMDYTTTWINLYSEDNTVSWFP